MTGSGAMSWINALARGFAIFLYVFVFTVWLPHFVLKLGPVAGASAFVADAVVLVVWGVGLLGGLVALRFAQERGLI